MLLVGCTSILTITYEKINIIVEDASRLNLNQDDNILVCYYLKIWDVGMHFIGIKVIFHCNTYVTKQFDNFVFM